MTEELPPPPRKKTRATRKRDYCRHLMRWGCHAEAAARAGVTDRTARRWREEDAEFFARCRAALDFYHAEIWQVARHRATKPDVKTVWYRGRPIGHIGRFNDTLLLRLVGRLPRRPA